MPLLLVMVMYERMRNLFSNPIYFDSYTLLHVKYFFFFSFIYYYIVLRFSTQITQIIKYKIILKINIQKRPILTNYPQVIKCHNKTKNEKLKKYFFIKNSKQQIM